MEVDKDDGVLFGQKVRDNCISDLKLAAGTKQTVRAPTNPFQPLIAVQWGEAFGFVLK